MHPDRPVRRAGRDYPAVIIDGFAGRSPVGLVEVLDSSPVLDPTLRAAGQGHLAAMLVANPSLFDGAVLALTDLSAGVIRVHVSSYFAMLATCDALRVDRSLRPRAIELAGGDALRSGAGRAAAIGISVATTVPTAEGHAFLVVRRAPGIADAGLWDVAPSGTLEPAGGDPLVANAATELREELDLDIASAELAKRLVVIGITVDLWRLRSEICLRLDLSDSEATRLDDAALVQGGEHDRLERISLTPAGFAGLWTRFGPNEFTPSAAGALALLEESTQVGPSGS